jgi:putative phosphoesterase
MRHVQQSQTLKLQSDEARVVVVADTHGRPHPALISEVTQRHPTLILHGGDIGTGPVIQELEAIAPVVAVRGNVDGRDLALPDSVDLTLERPTLPRLRLLLTHIAIYRMHLTRPTRNRAQAADAKLVVYGHSHLPFVGRDERFALFNPGSAGPRRFRLPITFGVLELGPGGLDLHHVDLQTGGRWTPA